MSFTFTSTEISDIENRLDQAKVGSIAFYQVYDFVFDIISNGEDINGSAVAPGVDASNTPADPQVWLWLQAARHVNKGEGPYSDFIRG
ncbi:MAG: hypothetical protein MK052_09060 [Alphaproteobacteria bacterium]|nr:hypothetical protein [Alphaproteobacteria bacterium]